LSPPSPKTRRTRLGRRSAARKASATGPPPSRRAINTSRAKPSSREATVAAPTTAESRARREGGGAVTIEAPSSQPEIRAESVDLMHALVEDRHDADLAVREPAPIDDMALIAKRESLDAEFGRHRPGQDPMRLDAAEGLEETLDI